MGELGTTSVTLENPMENNLGGGGKSSFGEDFSEEEDEDDEGAVI